MIINFITQTVIVKIKVYKVKTLIDPSAGSLITKVSMKLFHTAGHIESTITTTLSERDASCDSQVPGIML